MISNYNQQTLNSQQSIWANPDNTKYGYWEYFENGKRVKHEMWMSVLQEKYEWYPSGKLKFISHYGHYNKEKKHVFYLENGSIMEEFHFQTKTRRSFIKSYEYSSLGKIILINTYNSINGITKQGLQKREVFYPSGKLKMMENFTGGYQIKYYNEDGTERIN